MSNTTWLNVFKNQYKEKGDNKPLYGNANFTVTEPFSLEVGKTYNVALWKSEDKLDKNGNPLQMLSIKIEEKEEEGTETVKSNSLPDDEIEF